MNFRIAWRWPRARHRSRRSHANRARLLHRPASRPRTITLKYQEAAILRLRQSVVTYARPMRTCGVPQLPPTGHPSATELVHGKSLGSSAVGLSVGIAAGILASGSSQDGTRASAQKCGEHGAARTSASQSRKCWKALNEATSATDRPQANSRYDSLTLHEVPEDPHSPRDAGWLRSADPFAGPAARKHLRLRRRRSF